MSLNIILLVAFPLTIYKCKKLPCHELHKTSSRLDLNLGHILLTPGLNPQLLHDGSDPVQGVGKAGDPGQSPFRAFKEIQHPCKQELWLQVTWFLSPVSKIMYRSIQVPRSSHHDISSVCYSTLLLNITGISSRRTLRIGAHASEKPQWQQISSHGRWSWMFRNSQKQTKWNPNQTNSRRPSPLNQHW